MKETTQVPNIIFDRYLPSLSEPELKLLLVICRPTFGWHNKYTGKRKTRDRISHSQFMAKTKLSRRTVSKALKSLLVNGLIKVLMLGVILFIMARIEVVESIFSTL